MKIMYAKVLFMALSVMVIGCNSSGKTKAKKVTQTEKANPKSTAPEENESQTSDLPTGKWKLSAISDKGGSVAIPNNTWNMNLEILGTNRVALQTPCNNGGCSLKLSGIQFVISECALTEMYCAELERNEWQTKYLSYLQRISSYELHNQAGTLLLVLRGLEVELKFMPTE